jgi:hypothetical protein
VVSESKLPPRIALIQGSSISWLTGEIGLLAAGSALVLAAVDIIYVLAVTIPPVYLGDAVVEIGLVAGWGVGWARS